MIEWQPKVDQKHCVSHYGNIAQLGGLRRCILADGKATGVEAVDVNTGAGLEFTVLPGRGMDIVGCRYRGVPVSYLSKTGITSPAYHEGWHMQWLKSFFAGLVTTCGISNAGPYCSDQHPILGEIQYGLHGDISNIAAEQVCCMEDWTDDGYEMKVSGRVSEGRLHGEHLSLTRTITTKLGEKRFFIHDRYRNEGAAPEPLMFFYHINIGYPILDQGAALLLPTKEVWANTDVSIENMDARNSFQSPKANVIEQQFFHTFKTNENGDTVLAIVNEALELGFYLRYNVNQMPYFAQWKVERESEYVCAFEPGNCHPVGRDVQRKHQELEVLQPFQTHTVDMELGVLASRDEIDAIRLEIANL